MDKRNKLWRREQQKRVFKARMIFYAACGHYIIPEDGSLNDNPHWFELAKEKWRLFYKTHKAKCPVSYT